MSGYPSLGGGWVGDETAKGLLDRNREDGLEWSELWLAESGLFVGLILKDVLWRGECTIPPWFAIGENIGLDEQLLFTSPLAVAPLWSLRGRIRTTWFAFRQSLITLTWYLEATWHKKHKLSDNCSQDIVGAKTTDDGWGKILHVSDVRNAK